MSLKALLPTMAKGPTWAKSAPHEGEVVLAVELADATDAVQPLLVPRRTGQSVAGVSGIGDQTAVAQGVDDFLNQTDLRVHGVELDVA